MAQLGDLNHEAARLIESAGDALSDDIVARLGTIAGDSLDLLDRATHSNLDKALPAISRMVENGDLDRVVNAARVLGSAGDALSDDIIGRLAETASELMIMADRLARNENLLRLLDLLERDHVIDTLISLLESVSEAKASHKPTATGGISGLLKIMSDRDVQEGLQFVAAFSRAMKNN
jgi:uncharacterized protein YjgD (DUF1641 family)